MDLMIPSISLSLHENMTSSSSAYHHTPHTNFNPLKLVSLDPSLMHGQNIVMRLSKIQVKRCHVSILSRNTWMYGMHRSKNQLFRWLGGKVAVSPLTGQCSKMRTTHQAFQHLHPHHMFQAAFLFFSAINLTSMTIYQTQMKMKMLM